VAREKSATEVATANESVTTTTADEITTRGPSGAPKDSTPGASGTRPGWGCGDTKHTHSGPPGRPLATPPPGCTRP
jgi:hypothetical protein